jgi:hypothetical protein
MFSIVRRESLRMLSHKSSKIEEQSWLSIRIFTIEISPSKLEDNLGRACSHSLRQVLSLTMGANRQLR